MSLQCGQWQLPSEMEIVPGEKANEGIGALTHKYPRRAIFFLHFFAFLVHTGVDCLQIKRFARSMSNSIQSSRTCPCEISPWTYLA